MVWLVYRLCIRCITSYIIPLLNYREATTNPSEWVWPARAGQAMLRNKTMNSRVVISQLGAPSPDWWPVMLNLPIRPSLGSPSLHWLLRQWILISPHLTSSSSSSSLSWTQSWWGWPLPRWRSSSPAARWWISSIFEADMAVRGHYKVRPHASQKHGTCWNKRFGDSEMVLS